MAFVGISQYNHNQQIDEYEYDDNEQFYDDGVNYGSYLDVDDSEGKSEYNYFCEIGVKVRFFFTLFSVDTEEASESEYGHAGRTHNEPLEIKEL